MTVSTDAVRATATGTGASMNVPLPFLFFSTADIKVYVNGVLVTTGYTVTGAGTGSGTLTITAASGAAVVAVCDPFPSQEYDPQNGDTLQASSLELAFDRPVRFVHALKDRLNRAVRLGDGEPGAVPALTSAQMAVLQSQIAGGTPLPGLQFDSIALLRANGATYAANATAYVKAYTAGGTTGGGVFIRVPGTALDDGGAIIADAAGQRWARVWSGILSVADFGAVGNGVTNDAPAIQAALNASRSVWLPAGTYALASFLTIPADTTLLGVGTLQALSGYTASFLALMGARSFIRGVSFSGVNMPVPSAAWTGAGVGTARAPVGSAIFIDGSSGSIVPDAVIDGVSFSNFPSGPVCAFFADGLRIVGCNATTVQTYLGGETNGVFHLHETDYALIEDGQITGYNWKGYVVANSIQTRQVRCDANGGVTGHASHYITGGSDCAIIDGSQRGIGFGFKCFETDRPTVRGFTTDGAHAGGFFQGCPDWRADGMIVQSPSIGGLYVETTSTRACRGIADGIVVRRATAGTTSDHIGVRVLAVGSALSNVTVRNSYFENCLFSVVAGNSGLAQTNIDILDNRIVGGVQYGVIAAMGSGTIRGNRIEMDGSGSPTVGVAIYRDGVTTTGTVEISDNDFAGAVAAHIEVGAGLRLSYDTIRVTNNRARGGTMLLQYLGNANSADVVNHLVVHGNTGTGLTANGCQFTFNTTTATVLHYDANSFVNASFVDIGDVFTNTTNLRVKGLIPFTFTWDPGSLADGAGETSADITAVGAVLGASFILVSAPYDLQGLTCTAYVRADGIARVRLQNETGGGPIDLASGTWRGRVVNP